MQMYLNRTQVNISKDVVHSLKKQFTVYNQLQMQHTVYNQLQMLQNTIPILTPIIYLERSIKVASSRCIKWTIQYDEEAEDDNGRMD